MFFILRLIKNLIFSLVIFISIFSNKNNISQKCVFFIFKRLAIFLKMDIQKMSNFIYLRELYKIFLTNCIF